MPFPQLLTLRQAAVQYAQICTDLGYPLCFCRVRLDVVSARERFQYASFITAWRKLDMTRESKGAS